MDASTIAELRTTVSKLHELLRVIDRVDEPVTPNEMSPIPPLPMPPVCSPSFELPPICRTMSRVVNKLPEVKHVDPPSEQPSLSDSGERVILCPDKLPEVQGRCGLPAPPTPCAPIYPSTCDKSPKQQVELYFRFLDDESDRQCKYTFQRGARYGEQCRNRAIQGSHFCGPCSTKKLDNTKYGPLPLLPVGRKVRLEFQVYDALDDDSDDEADDEADEDEYYLTEAEVAALTERPTSDTNCTITSSDGKKFFVHKELLTGLGRFYREKFVETVPMDANDTTLHHFLDLVYGRTVYLNNWREAFELCLFLKATVDGFDGTIRYHFTRAFHVERKDYGEYISMLSRLYHNEIPKCLIEFSKRFLD